MMIKNSFRLVTELKSVVQSTANIIGSTKGVFMDPMDVRCKQVLVPNKQIHC